MHHRLFIRDGPSRGGCSACLCAVFGGLFLTLFFISGIRLEAQASYQDITPSTRMTEARQMYLTQGFTDPDQKVGNAIRIGDRKIHTKVNKQGELLLDIPGRGIEQVSDKSTVSVPVYLEKKKEKKSMELFFKKGKEGAWTYRNAMELHFNVGKDGLVVVDLNGNGRFNDVGVDGMTWRGGQYCFPLPAEDDRFATPHAELKNFTMGPWGQQIKAKVRRLQTVHNGTLQVLQGVNKERVKVGLTPRAEDPELSKYLQDHCKYMDKNDVLKHGETKGKPGYTSEGKKSGKRSILSKGRRRANVAKKMVDTYFHRLDVVRPDTQAFGVGYENGYAGIDGRGNRDDSTPSNRWPYRIPAPNQRNVPTRFQTESPDPLDGDAKAGFPITMYFQSDDIRLESHKLIPLNGPRRGKEIPCYTFDPGDGGMHRFSKVLCMIAKQPLRSRIVYEVTMKYKRSGNSRTVKWRFATKGAPGKGWQQY